MQEETKESEELQINLGEIMRYLLKKWWIVLVSVVVCLVLGMVVGKIIKKTVYKSEATYVVSYSASNSTSEISTGLSLTYYMMSNSVEILSRDSFYEAVLARLEDQIGADKVKSYDLTAEKLKKYLSFSCTDSTSKSTLIYVSAISGDADLSYDIICAVADNYTNEAGNTTTFIAEYIQEKYTMTEGKMDFSQIDTLKRAEEPESDSSVMKWTLIGGVAGLLGSVVVLGAIVVLDTRVKGEKDLTEKYGAAILGSIPDLWDKNLNKSGGGRDTPYKKE